MLNHSITKGMTTMIRNYLLHRRMKSIIRRKAWILDTGLKTW